MKAEKECFSGSASAEGFLRKRYGKKEKLHMHAIPTFPHILDSSLELCGHFTSPTTSGHGDFIALSSTDEEAFGSS